MCTLDLISALRPMNRTPAAPAKRLRPSPPSAASRTSRTNPVRNLRAPSFSASSQNSKAGDVLLTEQVDRLSRLTAGDWQKLRAALDTKQIRVVALDLPTSWMMAGSANDFTGRMFDAVNAMMLDVLAAVARKDSEDRRRRQAQGQAKAKAKAEGKYRGRPEDVGRNGGIPSMLKSGDSWTIIESGFGCSRATIAKVAKRIST